VPVSRRCNASVSPPSFSSRFRPPPTSPLFPYTTLFRSRLHAGVGQAVGDRARGAVRREAGVDEGEGQACDGPQLDRDDVVEDPRSEEHTSELQSLTNLVCRLLLEKKKRRYSICSPSERC